VKGCIKLGAVCFVAQTSSLLYRGFLIRTHCELSALQNLRKVCRLEVGDTAG
jgi:hypothetical protein